MPAPIALFIYNRPDHLSKTLSALRLNLLARESDLIVFSDGPKSELDAGPVNECRRIASAEKGFASVRVEISLHNRGLANSIIAGVTSVLESYGKIIVLEDDIVTSPHFLWYMNEALAWYRDDNHVFSISGYSYPPEYLVIPNDYCYDNFASYRFSSWGWACWNDRWSKVDWEMKYYDYFIRDQSAQSDFNRGGNDLTSMLVLQKRGRIDSWAIRFAYAHFSLNQHCIYPVKTLVKNIGLDNSGTHTGASPMYSHKYLDPEWKPQRFCPGNLIDHRITRAFYTAASPPKISTCRRVLNKLLKMSSLRTYLNT